MPIAIDKTISRYWKTLRYHVAFWAVLVIYEVPLAGLLSDRWADFWDYGSHYFLNICLFYFHSHIALKRFNNGFIFNFFYIITELFIAFLGNILILYILKSLGVPIIFDRLNRLFFIASGYRFIFIILISTAYWYLRLQILNLKKINSQQAMLMNAELENGRLRNTMLEERLSRHKSSIIPHFLFNTLHIIYHQLRKVRPVEAKYLLNLSEIMQYNLSPLDSQYKIPLSHELTYLRNYIVLRQLEHDYQIKVHIPISEEEGDKLLIIPLVMATLIENVFHHGMLTDRRYPAELKIWLNRRKLRVRIKNRIRKTRFQKHGLGMENTLKRLAHFYPGKYHYRIHTYRQFYFQKLYIRL